MTTPTKVIIDCSTGEESVVELTAEEITQRESDALAFAAQQEEAAQAATALAALKDSAKAKLIAGTPLTAEEADTLVI
jgi:phosphoenolpyruvate-protein kinase (PTS system EI component)